MGQGIGVYNGWYYKIWIAYESVGMPALRGAIGALYDVTSSPAGRGFRTLRTLFVFSFMEDNCSQEYLHSAARCSPAQRQTTVTITVVSLFIVPANAEEQRSHFPVFPETEK